MILSKNVYVNDNLRVPRNLQPLAIKDLLKAIRDERQFVVPSMMFIENVK